MPKLIRPADVIELAVERTRPHVMRDREFEERFGKWQRPTWAPRYNLERLKNLIAYTPDQEFFDLKTFVLALAPEDRYLAGEIARFVFEEFDGLPATDKTIGTFRLAFLRRLDAVGY